MEYQVEEVSELRRKLTVTVGKEEVNAAIEASLALYKGSVNVKGFRKGKVPNNVIESMYKDTLYKEAEQNLINVHIQEILQEGKYEPCAELNIDGTGGFKRGEDFVYTITFDVMPTFELPNYEGYEIFQPIVDIEDSHIERILERERIAATKFIEADADAPYVDGDVIEYDFRMYLNGKKRHESKNQRIVIGRKDALSEFEEFLMTLPVGHSGETTITLPDNFVDRSLQGKEALFKVHVHKHLKAVVPDLNDEFAKNHGFDSLDEMKEALKVGQVQSYEEIYKSDAIYFLGARLLTKCQIPLPQSLVDSFYSLYLQKWVQQQAQKGIAVNPQSEEAKTVAARFYLQAQNSARMLILGVAIAKKEGLKVTDREVERALAEQAHKLGRDVNEYRNACERTGEIFLTRDRILSDKGFDLAYSRSQVTLLPYDEAMKRQSEMIASDEAEAKAHEDARKAEAGEAVEGASKPETQETAPQEGEQPGDGQNA